MAGDDLSVSKIINRGRVEHVYGVQTAPRTWSGVPSTYDEIATWWDSHYGASEEERCGILEIVRGLGDFRKRRVLDIGCGTGLALDLGITEPERYVGIDPSQGMLNALVFKHPSVAGVHPMTFGDAIERRVLGGTRFDLVLALGGAASYLTEEDLVGAYKHGSGSLVLTAFAQVVGTLSRGREAEQVLDTRTRQQRWVSSVGGTTRHLGGLIVGVINRRAIESHQ